MERLIVDDGRFSVERQKQQDAERAAERAELAAAFAARTRDSAIYDVVFMVMIAAAYAQQAFTQAWSPISIGIAAVIGSVVFRILAPSSDLIPDVLKFAPRCGFVDWSLEVVRMPFSRSIVNAAFALGVLFLAESPSWESRFIAGCIVLAGAMSCYSAWQADQDEYDRMRKTWR